MPTNDEIIKKYDLEGDGDLGIDVHEALKEARADTAKQIFDELEKLRIDYGFDTEYLISEFEKKRIEYLNLKNKYKVD